LKTTPSTHTAIRESLRTRIEAGEWALGALIPGEIELSAEYGCARATINRALRSLADEGLIERKRKGGTRVRPLPLKQAVFAIPVVREQVESTGSSYRHEIITRKQKVPPPSIRTRLRIKNGDKALYLETIHLADGRPFSFEVRWVNIHAVPGILTAPLELISANEWLIQSAPFSSGDLMFSAVNANKHIASALDARDDAAIFVVDRTTWLGDDFITTTKLYYKEGYQLYSTI